MESGREQLAVRRHSRRECDLPGWVRVGDLHAAQVVFSRAVSESGGAIPARIVDCSEGGLGLHTSVYLPKGVTLVVGFRLGGADAEAERELHLRIQRGTMVDRSPTYYLGTSAVHHPGSEASLAALLAWASGPAPSAGEAA